MKDRCCEPGDRTDGCISVTGRGIAGGDLGGGAELYEFVNPGGFATANWSVTGVGIVESCRGLGFGFLVPVEKFKGDGTALDLDCC